MLHKRHGEPLVSLSRLCSHRAVVTVVVVIIVVIVFVVIIIVIVVVVAVTVSFIDVLFLNGIRIISCDFMYHVPVFMMIIFTTMIKTLIQESV